MQKITSKEYKETMSIIESIGPMIKMHDYKTFRNKSLSPKLDIKVLHPEGKKTTWGDAQMSDHYVTDDLSHAGLEFMDWMVEGYQIWFKKQPLVAGDESKPLTNAELRYVISFLVGEVGEGWDFPSQTPIVGIKRTDNWFILEQKACTVSQSLQFWSKFGNAEYYFPGHFFEVDALYHALQDGVTHEFCKWRDSTKPKKVSITKKMAKQQLLPCEHCNKWSEYVSLQWEDNEYDQLKKYGDELDSFEIQLENLEKEKEQIRYQDYKKQYENLQKLIQNLKLLTSHYARRIENYEKYFAPLIIETNSKKFYKCHFCGKIGCKEKIMLGKICHQCYHNFDINTLKEKWPHLVEEYGELFSPSRFSDGLEEEREKEFDELIEKLKKEKSKSINLISN